MWALALCFGVAALVGLRAGSGSLFETSVRTLWLCSPFIAVAMVLIMSDQRQALPKPARGKAAIPNPALTVQHLNSLVEGSTKLEAKRKLDAHASQIATVKAKVANIEDDWMGLVVRVITQPQKPHSAVPMQFRRSQADALEIIKPGDWIEFSGRVEHSSVYGWTLTDCEFVGRVEPPKPPRRPRARPA